MKKLLFFILLSITLSASALQLSDKARFSLITAAPGEALYSTFGHSAILLSDPENGIEKIYNYGVFSFSDDAKFYIDFVKGHLNYKLAAGDSARFIQAYQYYGRSVYQSKLNLTQDQKQALYNFLENNLLPENRYYAYHYYYDNCATRVRDALVVATDSAITFHYDYLSQRYTVRQLTDVYLNQNSWQDWGIDFLMGCSIDTIARPGVYMYIPDFLQLAFEHATINHSGQQEPLVSETVLLYDAPPVPQPNVPWPFRPYQFFAGLFILILLKTWWYRNKRTHCYPFDGLLFLLIGFIGLVPTLVWFATDHYSAEDNYNVIWANPLLIPIGLALLFTRGNRIVRFLLGVYGLGLFLILITWPWLPQQLHLSLAPLVLGLLVRCINYGVKEYRV